MISNLFFSAKLHEGGEAYEKILTLWLNTTWGILSMLLYREETRGPFSELSIPQWRLLPILDVYSLDRETVEKLVMAFDSCAEKSLRRIPRQFSSDPRRVDPVRLELDLRFLKAVDPGLDDKKIRDGLLKIYGAVNRFLNTWIG